MCMMCNGATFDDVLFDLDARIARFGWALQAVQGEGDRPGWVYTIGLTERFAHPELVVVTCRYDDAGALLNELGRRVRDGERFDACEHLDTSSGLVRFVGVHSRQSHTSSLMGLWHDYYDATGEPPGPLQVLQVLGPGLTCHRHDAGNWMLDRPFPSLADGGPGRPPRAVRRRRARRGHQRHAR